MKKISAAYADAPPLPPEPYRKEIEDSSLVLYMTPEGRETDEHLKSGLYDSANPDEPIYLIDAYIYRGDTLYLSKDGRYFAHLGWASMDHKNDGTAKLENAGVAISFYKDGAVQKTYKVADLLDDISVAKISVSHIQWDIQNERRFDSDKNILSVAVLDGRNIEFDITTGKIIGGSLPAAIVVVIGAALLLCCALILFIKRKKKLRQ